MMTLIIGVVLILLGGGLIIGCRRNVDLVPGLIGGWIATVVGGSFIVGASVIVVPAGHVRVPVLFGQVRTPAVHEGIHLVNPLLSWHTMSVRTETYTMSVVSTEGEKRGDDSILALSKDGLNLPMDITVAYRLDPTSAPFVYGKFGPTYVDKILRPAARTAIREATSQFTSQEAYAQKREALGQRMEELLADRIASLVAQYSDAVGQGVFVQQIMLRHIAFVAYYEIR